MDNNEPTENRVKETREKPYGNPRRKFPNTNTAARGSARAAVAALLLAPLLASCAAGAGTESPTPTGTPAPGNAQATPVLQITGHPTPTRIDYTVQTGSLPAGTTIAIALYGDPSGQNPTCTSPLAAQGTAVSTGPGQAIAGTLSTEYPGKYKTSLTAPGYSTPCTTDVAVKVQPFFAAADNPAPITHGQAPQKTIYVKGLDKANAGGTNRLTVPIRRSWHGPYSTAGEAAAAGCPDTAPTAATADSTYQDPRPTKDAGTDQITPGPLNTPGAYFETITVAETDLNWPASTDSCHAAANGIPTLTVVK